jgi:hydroxyacid-oxoacid transhydrogenase|tara:strand:+ start:6265 stop:7542 length:1278 start_codon:yes stop_codon:yes gene_type:complete
MTTETAFNMASSNLRFGSGATREIGMELADMGVRHALLVTDPNLAALPPVATALQALDDEKIRYTLFDSARVEPTDGSLQEAIAFADAHPADAFVAIGGGSVIDTAKAANLYSSCPADLLDYVNAPIGKAMPIPEPLKPLIAIPTTAGTGSETTGVLIFDLVQMHAKTGVAGLRLKPTLGLLDPDNTRSLPPQVAACTGLDVLTHAVESYTALSYDQRPKPQRPLLRPAYQGSNPISDTWSLEALRMVAEFLPRAVKDPDDDQARGMMLLAAAYAGMGFGNAGVHLAHGMSYPVSGMVRDYKPDGYAVDHAIVPHGMSVVINAPAVFRFTAPACPERHLQAAAALGADVDGAKPEDAGMILADRIIEFMQVLEIPNGLSAIGFSSNEIPALVEGTLPQHRVTKLSPQPVGAEELEGLFQDAMRYW